MQTVRMWVSEEVQSELENLFKKLSNAEELKKFLSRKTQTVVVTLKEPPKKVKDYVRLSMCSPEDNPDSLVGPISVEAFKNNKKLSSVIMKAYRDNLGRTSAERDLINIETPKIPIPKGEKIFLYIYTGILEF